MNDRDLKKLANLSTAPASDAARHHALDAAMLAFDEQLERTESKNSTSTQGLASQPRPISTTNQLWSFVMNVFLKPTTLATATGVVALPMAAVVAWNVMDAQFNPSSPLKIVSDQPLPKSEIKTTAAEEVTSIAAQPEYEAFAAADQIAEAPITRLAESPAPGQQLLSQSASRPLGVIASQKSIRGRPIVQPMPVPGRGDGHGLGGSERYTQFEDNGVVATAADPVSTFSIDVDTASYARVRAALNAGSLPLKDMVRVEEMVNYFDYAYALPDDPAQPFKPTVTLTQTPWNAHTQLLQIGIKGFDPTSQSDGSASVAAAPDTNLVLLLDVSGSMAEANKLPLLIKSFKLLLRQLKPTDTVSIVTYAGRSATILDSVKASDRATILHALENLQAGGSTAGAGGIRQAYRLAEKNFLPNGMNRVMLATDGDFNVGLSDPDQLKELISSKRKSGVFLSVFGFGQGNYNDALMQKLAQNGNGQAAYIDSLAEARKALVEEAGGTMFTIAGDVKIQMEFNPAEIAEYRLIGYETRALKRQDFNNDQVDAGDIGAGHTVTALYELTPVGSPAVLNSPLRYGEDKTTNISSNEIGYLKLRYKLPGESTSRLLQQAVLPTDQSKAGSALLTDSQFAAAVAAFGQKLRGHPSQSDFSYQQIADLAQAHRGDDRLGYRAAFIQLVRLAGALSD